MFSQERIFLQNNTSFLQISMFLLILRRNDIFFKASRGPTVGDTRIERLRFDGRTGVIFFVMVRLVLTGKRDGVEFVLGVELLGTDEGIAAEEGVVGIMAEGKATHVLSFIELAVENQYRLQSTFDYQLWRSRPTQRTCSSEDHTLTNENT